MVYQICFPGIIRGAQVTLEFAVTLVNFFHVPLQGLPVYKSFFALLTFKWADLQMNTSDVIVQVTLLAAPVVTVVTFVTFYLIVHSMNMEGKLL